MSRITGGCQCGAVRYALSATPTSASLCHCRMCQKATGQPIFASATVAMADFEWTRGQAASFRSSSLAERDFCAACGTSLTFRVLGEARISVTLGSLDAPEMAPPTEQVGIEARLSWWGGLDSLPALATSQSEPPGIADLVSYQHPDHDTAPEWRAPSRRD